MVAARSPGQISVQPACTGHAARPAASVSSGAASAAAAHGQLGRLRGGASDRLAPRAGAAWGFRAYRLISAWQCATPRLPGLPGLGIGVEWPVWADREEFL